MCFVPVKFRVADRTIRHQNGVHTLHLPPIGSAVFAIQSTAITDAATRGDRLDFAKDANDFELHRRSLRPLWTR
jgi:hypothetical protein